MFYCIECKEWNSYSESLAWVRKRKGKIIGLVCDDCIADGK